VSALTTVERTTTLHSLRALVLDLMPSLSWRHHGIGCLQGYVIEDVEPEVRVHVWSRALVKPGMDESGGIHDHRFDLVSHVLIGTVGHEEVLPIEDADGGWLMLALTHARAARDSAYHGPTAPLPGRFDTLTTNLFLSEGQTYRYPAGAFHRSIVMDGVAVTVVEKHRQSNAAARILYPAASSPVMAFGHEIDWAIAGAVLREAQAALRSRFAEGAR
jgi:hypothetical protein